MRNTQCKEKVCWCFWLTIVAVVSLPTLVDAQESGQEAGKDKLATQDASRKTGSPDAEPASPIGLSWTNSYIEQIGTSGVLAGNREGIGWGSLFISSAQLSGIVEDFGATNTQPSRVFKAAVLQGTVVYNHPIASPPIPFQYYPNIAFSAV